MPDATPAITPELVALVDAGDGCAEVVDPATQRVFVITEQRPHPCAHPESDEELAEMLREANAQIERGEVCEMSTEEILAEARRRARSAR